jgi:capping protein alpha
VQAMNAYVNRQFRKGTTQYSVFTEQNQLKVEISCHNFNFKNFWGGEFLSSWTVDLEGNTLTGSIKVHNHYFEQGNIQFNINKNIAA